jgi:hypothetical protein
MENNLHHKPQTILTYYIVQSPSPTPTPNSGQQPTGLDWTTIIVALLTGVTTGIIVPIITPYVKWRFEKERRRYDRRLQFIETWQKYLSESIDKPELLEPAYILTMPSFSSLERQMTKAFRIRFIKELDDFKNLNYEKVKLLLESGNFMETKLEEYRSPDDGDMEKEEARIETYFGMKDLDKELDELNRRIEARSTIIRNVLREALSEIEEKWGLL